MREQLIIRLHSLDSDQAEWLVFDSRGNRIGFPQRGALSAVQSLATQRRVTVILPGEDILQVSAIVPGRNRQQIARAAPYAIEEQVAGDVDELFFALLDVGSTTAPSRFALLERKRLRDWLQLLETHGITADAMLPDHAALPAPGQDRSHWWFESGRLLVRDAERGFDCPADDATLLLKRLPEETEVHVWQVGDASLPENLPEGTDIESIDADRALTELAAVAAARKDGGLLQQEFQPARRETSELARWRRPGIAAVAMLVVALAAWGIEVYQLKRESDFLDQQMRGLFERAMPGSRFDPATAAAQMRIRLRGEQGSSDARLLQYLAAVGQSLEGLGDARFNGFSYRNGKLEITVSVKDAKTLEDLQNRLRERTAANIQLQSANGEGDRLEGRILLEGGAA